MPRYPNPDRSAPPAARPLAWHTFEVRSVAAKLGTDPNVGLSHAAARARRERYGDNRIAGLGWKSRLTSALACRVSGRSLALVAAAAVAAALGASVEALCLIGVEALSQFLFRESTRRTGPSMHSPTCRVQREGRRQELLPEQLVPGDVVFITVGETIPADLRLMAARNLAVDESRLTGRARPSAKGIAPARPDADLMDMTSMVWMGTRVVRGEGTGLVVATGLHTAWSRLGTLQQNPAAWLLASPGLRRGSPGETVAFLLLGGLTVGLAGWLGHLSWLRLGGCAAALLAAAAIWQWPLGPVGGGRSTFPPPPTS